MATVYSDISLGGMNSFGVEARADRLVEWESNDDLCKILAEQPRLLDGRWDILGGGNNTLFTTDYKGTLLHCKGRGITVTDECSAWVDVRVEAGEKWDDVVAWSVERGLWGAENLSWIPSSVGATAVQNIGAYGVEAKEVIRSVEMLDAATLKTVVLAAEYCAFGYRDSVFKHTLKGRVIITAVNYRFTKTPAPKLDYGALRTEVERLGEATAANIRAAVIAIRRAKLPDPAVTGNAGSFFTNPIVGREVAERLLRQYPDMPSFDVASDHSKRKLAAGWLIDRAGWKGYNGGRVGVHSAQALVLVNLGGATGADVMDLAERICADVERKFGVAISPEVNIL